MATPKFYISRYIDGAWEADVSITDQFDGLRYSKSTGISDKGAIKNIYTESYAEAEEVRVFLPEKVVRETTDVEFEFVFEGENRRNVYDSFVEYISGHKLRYWDNIRNRIVYIILTKAISLDDDFVYGSNPYMYGKFKFMNLKGDSEKKE